MKTPYLENVGISKQKADLLLESYGALYPIGRYGMPDDIGYAILFLASDMSSFTTGTNMAVDGGHMADNVNIEGKRLDDLIG